MRVNIWCVLPNSARDASTWSPDDTRAAMAVKTADIPDAVAMPSSPPSSRHSLLMNSSVFGLEYRL